MIIHNFYFWLEYYLCFLSTITHMNMNRLVFVQVKEEPYLSF